MKTNPYSPPAGMPSGDKPSVNNAENRSGKFSVEQLPLIMKTPVGTLVVAILLSILFAALAIGGIAGFFLYDMPLLFAALWSAVCAIASYLFATAVYGEFTIESTGFRMRGVRNRQYLWQDVASWSYDEKIRLVVIEDRRGKERIVANFAVTQLRSDEIAKAFTHFLGEPRRQK